MEGRLAMHAWALRYSGERWREVLRTSVGEEAFRERLREATGVGLPLGDSDFVRKLARALDRDLERRPVGRPRKQPALGAGARAEKV